VIDASKTYACISTQTPSLQSPSEVHFILRRMYHVNVNPMHTAFRASVLRCGPSFSPNVDGAIVQRTLAYTTYRRAHDVLLYREQLQILAQEQLLLFMLLYCILYIICYYIVLYCIILFSTSCCWIAYTVYSRTYDASGNALA